MAGITPEELRRRIQSRLRDVWALHAPHHPTIQSLEDALAHPVLGAILRCHAKAPELVGDLMESDRA